MCPISSSWAQAPFRRMPVTIRRARSQRWRFGRRTRSATNISKIRGNSSMRNVAATIVALAGVAASPSPGGSTDLQDFSLVTRGRYLVDAADCTSCHTVPGRNQPFAGGRPIETPFGTLISPNITPDPDTGIGTWTDDEFDTAVRLGRTRNGAHLYPAMPYP